MPHHLMKIHEYDLPRFLDSIEGSQVLYLYRDATGNGRGFGVTWIVLYRDDAREVAA